MNFDLLLCYTKINMAGETANSLIADYNWEGSGGPSAGVRFFFFLLIVQCLLLVLSERRASACLIMLSAKQGSHWYHF